MDKLLSAISNGSVNTFDNVITKFKEQGATPVEVKQLRRTVDRLLQTTPASTVADIWILSIKEVKDNGKNS